jgi:hypothetical protein
MATITPALTIVAGIPRITWTGVSTADTMVAYGPITGKSLEFASVLKSGTWGGSTVTLAGSEDGTTYLTLKDRTGTAVSSTANARYELSTSASYLKPTSSGGTADNVDVVVVLRGV